MVPRSNAPIIATYLKGALFGLAAVSIWAGWSALTRLAVTTRFDAWDIAAPRFGIAGCLLAPMAVRRGLALAQLGWSGLALLIARGRRSLCAAGRRGAPVRACPRPGCPQSGVHAPVRCPYQRIGSRRKAGGG